MGNERTTKRCNVRGQFRRQGQLSEKPAGARHNLQLERQRVSMGVVFA